MIWTNLKNLKNLKNLMNREDSRSFKNLLEGKAFSESRQTLLIRSAEALRQKRRLNEALMLIRKLLTRRSELSTETVFLLRHVKAECLLDRKEFKKAISVYNSILSTEEDSCAYANRGLAYWELKKYKKALNDYLKATVLDPKNAVAQRSVGELFNKLGTYARAVEYLKRAIRLNRNCSRSFCELGVSYYNIQDWVKAYRALKKAIKIDPTNKAARIGIKKIENHFELGGVAS